MILNYIFSYAAYALGAMIFILDKIAEYKKLAQANPDPNIKFNYSHFWDEEWISVIKILLIGIASMILMLPLKGISVDFKGSDGNTMFNLGMETMILPVYLILGWSGGRATIAVAGKYKKSLYESVGITSEENNKP